MSWSEDRPMAVKKAVTPKAGSTSKPATSPTAAPTQAAPTTSPQPAAATKGAAKKAPAVKLSDAQGRVLSSVHQAGEMGYLGNKAQAKTLDALFHRKLIKRGKREGGFYRYQVTKAGQKHVPASSTPAP